MCSSTCWLWGKETTCSKKIELIESTVLVVLTVPKQTWVSSLMGYLIQYMSTKDTVWKKSRWQSCHLYSTPVSLLCTCWTQRLFLENRACFKTTSLPEIWSRRQLVNELISQVSLGMWEWDMPQSEKNAGASNVYVFCVFPRAYSFLGNPHTLHTCYADDVMVYV